jgi:hypothetical protein
LHQEEPRFQDLNLNQLEEDIPELEDVDDEDDDNIDGPPPKVSHPLLSLSRIFIHAMGDFFVGLMKLKYIELLLCRIQMMRRN